MDVKLSHQPVVRAGIIPQLVYNNNVFYALSIDLDTGIIGDFGGHRESFDQDLMSTAIREFNEESHGCFRPLTREDLKQSVKISGPETVEYIVTLTSRYPPDYYNRRFQNLAEAHQDTREISDILWLTTEQLLKILEIEDLTTYGLRPYAMYSRIYHALLHGRNVLEKYPRLQRSHPNEL